jgi:hypothetical protein
MLQMSSKRTFRKRLQVKSLFFNLDPPQADQDQEADHFLDRIPETEEDQDLAAKVKTETEEEEDQ